MMQAELSNLDMVPQSGAKPPGSDREADHRAAAFFEAAHRIFLTARDAAGAAERSLIIAGYRVQLLFAGEAMIPAMTEAFAHLAAPSPGPPADLTVCIWDSVSTETRMLPPPWSTDDRSAQGLVEWSETRRFQTLFQPTTRTLDMLNRRQSMGIHWIPDIHRLPDYETVSPLRTLLYWWMRGHGRQLVHAGAVGTGEGAVLLPARSGSGKSTAVLTCLAAGLLCTGDDKVLLATDGECLHAYSVYSSAALSGSHLKARFPHLFPLVEDQGKPEEEKRYVFLYDRYPDQLPASLPVRAVLVPQVSEHRHTELSRSTPAESLKALVPSTVFSVPGAGRETFKSLTEMIRPLPHYTLHLGTDLSQIPRVISDLLAHLD